MHVFQKVFFALWGAVISVGIFFVSQNLMAAWSEPACDPGPNPGACNASEPINVGTETQSKAGSLGVMGNLGVGTGTPSAKLFISGDTTADWKNASIWIQNSAAGGRIFAIASRLDNPGQPYLGFTDETAGQVRMYLDQNGNVGIGGYPTNKLSIEGSLDMAAGTTIYNRGRMHVFGEEILYLLNRSGTVVSKAWGGNGNLSVEGEEYVSGKFNFNPHTNTWGSNFYFRGWAEPDNCWHVGGYYEAPFQCIGNYIDLGQHSFCALGTVFSEHLYDQGGGSAICNVYFDGPANTWRLYATEGYGGGVGCGVNCF